ncbi:helix-turn-helix domain-containing protein [Brevundimonas sp.]|uniref:helix-turn-helix domain-containing protein n=1 Tax=Brevundimonas sp. TaxID=1871086 RepID=UPI002D4A99BE|nr:helix-turn-helix domain-containing protein [Brevundimonas sp.]HYC66587.1 helix-turn-helix domain-containing protein [Brevundimonas sp.]
MSRAKGHDRSGVGAEPSDSHAFKLAYTVEEAGRAIGVSRSTVFDMIRMGEVSAKKLRGRTVIARAELQRIVSEAPDARPP